MQAFNPYLPSYEYVPDGEPRVFGDRIYIFGSHDRFNGEDFCLNDYICWSAPVSDPADWSCSGIMYRAEQDPAYQEGYVMCAPDVVQGPDGKFYLYYEFQMLTTTSVAVSDRPEGPYEYYGAVRYPDGKVYGITEGEIFMFDPAVLVDDDGRVYLYSGFSPLPGFLRDMMSRRPLGLDGGCCFELEQDMLTIKSGPKLVIPGHVVSDGTGYEGHAFFEASSIRKVGDKYYLVYSSELSHELCYAVSEKPDEGYIYGGTIVSIGDVGYKGNQVPVNYTGNTHGGIIKAGDQWYVFYHRQTNKQKCCRQGCAEKITILPDGSIPQVEITSCGLNAGPLRGEGRYETYIACNLRSSEGTFPYLEVHENDEKGIHPYLTQSGTDRECDGDQYIANMTDGSQVGFKYFEFEGLKEVSVLLCGSGEGEMIVSTEPDGDAIVSILVKAGVVEECFSAALDNMLSGIHALYFTFKGKGYVDFKAFDLMK